MVVLFFIQTVHHRRAGAGVRDRLVLGCAVGAYIAFLDAIASIVGGILTLVQKIVTVASDEMQGEQ